ncbi:MAG TPA: hypothetical protein VFV33_16700 [Gemmatimonadaceae bacterium]|nr:hypothetical protein [Gemmatimonadaceae bacterium]
MSTGRMILAVLAGAAVWAALWIGGTLGAAALVPSALPTGQPVTNGATLAALIVYSVVLSVLAGWLTATVASRNPMPAVWALAILQLALGIGIEVSAWNMTPVWYHLVFLALLVPATVYGGRLRARRRPVHAGLTA